MRLEGGHVQSGFLVLPGFTQLDRAGFSEDAGWGHPAYNRRFDSWTHVLVLAEPWPGIGFTRPTTEGPVVAVGGREGMFNRGFWFYLALPSLIAPVSAGTPGGDTRPTIGGLIRGGMFWEHHRRTNSLSQFLSFMGRGTTYSKPSVFETRSKATGNPVTFRLAGRQPGQAGRLCYPVRAETPIKNRATGRRGTGPGWVMAAGSIDRTSSAGRCWYR